MDETQAPSEPVKVEKLSMDTIKPKANCKKCYGTGRLGLINGDPNDPYLCTCMIKIMDKLKEERKAKKAAEAAIKAAEAKVAEATVPAPIEVAPVVEATPVEMKCELKAESGEMEGSTGPRDA